jgi:membrane protease YdiL (CAAX protease family)
MTTLTLPPRLGLNLLLFGAGLAAAAVAGEYAGAPPLPAAPAAPEMELGELSALRLWLLAAAAGGLFLGGLGLLTWWLSRLRRGEEGFFPAGPELPQAPWGLADLLGLCGVLLLAAAALRAGWRPGAAEGPPWGVFAAFLAELGGCAWALALALTLPGGRRALGLRSPRPWRHALRGAAAWLAFLPPYRLLIMISVALVAGLQGEAPTAEQIEPVVLFLRRGEEHPLFLVLLLLFAVVGAPVAEELLFRGFLFGALRRHLSLVWAALLCGLAFGAVHASWVKLLPVGALGAFLCVLRERSGGLAAPVAAHAANNAAGVLFLLLTLP